MITRSRNNIVPQFRPSRMKKNQPATIILPEPEEPIRAELFSLERLERHAESLAAAQIVTNQPSRGPPPIPPALDHRPPLFDSHRAVAPSIPECARTTPPPPLRAHNS